MTRSERMRKRERAKGRYGISMIGARKGGPMACIARLVARLLGI